MFIDDKNLVREYKEQLLEEERGTVCFKFFTG